MFLHTRNENQGGIQMELWDIYDREKQVTGRIMVRDDWCLKEGEYHLAVLAVIKRSDGKYLITKRAENKAWGAGWWEVPGGAVKAGESSLDAILREIKEETGLDAKGAKGGLLYDYHRENIKEGDNYFVDIYLFEMDFSEKEIHLQEEETTDFQIAEYDEIASYGAAGFFLHFESLKKAFDS